MTEKEFNKIFSDNLTYYMVKTGTSRGDLAKLLNVSVTSVANWCRGKKTPRMDKVDRICTHFGIKRSDLMSEYPGDVIDPSLSEDILTATEERLLADFRQLDSVGQDLVCNYTSDLVASGRYSLSTECGSGSGSGEDETA